MELIDDLKEKLEKYFAYVDGVLYWRVNKGRAYAGSVASTEKGNGYKKLCLDGKEIMVHRAVFLMMRGYLPKYIDHIDGDRGNNRVENLREATAAQNRANSAVRGDSKTSLKGIELLPSNRWRAKITVGGEAIHLGVFDSAEEATIAYVSAAKSAWGEYAKHQKSD